MKNKTLALALILAVVLAGCTSAGLPAAGETWLLDKMTVNGTTYDLSTTQPVTLEFQTERVVGGSTGCNSYSGEMEFNEDGTVTSGAFTTTLMACETGMDIEAAYLDALSRIDSYEHTQYELTLLADDGQTELVFQLMRNQ